MEKPIEKLVEAPKVDTVKPVEKPKEKETKESLKVTTEESFMNLINAASSVMGEAKIQFAEAGMRLAGMDPANNCMIDLRLGKDEFKEFESIGDPEIIVDILNLKKVLKNLGSKDITIELMEGFIKVSNGRRRFAVPLIAEIEDKLKELPTLNYECSFIPSKTIKEDIKILAEMKSSILFELRPDGLTMKCKGDIQTATFNGEGKVNCKEIQKARFADDYLLKMFSWKGDIKKIEIKTDYPIRLTYDYGIVILAPRVLQD